MKRLPLLLVLFLSVNAFASKPKYQSPPEGSIQSIELSKEFDQNAYAAEKKYADKDVLIWGIVLSVGSDIAGDPYVITLGKDRFSPVQLMVPKSDESLLKIKKYDTVVVTCHNPAAFAGSVIARECKINDVVKSTVTKH